MKILVVSKPEFLVKAFGMFDPKCNTHTYKVVSLEDVAELQEPFDFIVALGGDGTMLTACRFAAKYPAAVVGINKGSLGFLAAHQPKNDVEHPITWLANNHAQLSASPRFLAKTTDSDANIDIAFNEFTISSPYSDKILTYDLYIGNEQDVVYTGQHKANGVIIATPSGSTAYSLSCGGSLVDPHGTKSLQIVPIAPFSMTSRALLVSSQNAVRAKARIVVRASAVNPVELKADGQPSMLITHNKAIDFVIGPCVEVLHDPDLTWYSLLVNKLNWGQNSGRIEYHE